MVDLHTYTACPPTVAQPSVVALVTARLVARMSLSGPIPNVVVCPRRSAGLTGANGTEVSLLGVTREKTVVILFSQNTESGSDAVGLCDAVDARQLPRGTV